MNMAAIVGLLLSILSLGRMTQWSVRAHVSGYVYVDGEDDANLWPGGGSGKRVTGRSDCASNIGTGFRSVVDVDLVGIWDPSQKLESAGEELQCRPPEPYS